MIISQDTLTFLKELESNNNKDWFDANKKRYERAKNEFTAFVEALIPRIATFDQSIAGTDAKKSVFRIFRDVRFSNDKTPYHVRFGAHLLAGGRKMEDRRAGYYIRIAPGKSILAGGAYLPPSPWLKSIREEIAWHPDEFKKIIHDAAFKKNFNELEGESLKTSPRDYPADHPEIDLLKRKSFLAVHELSDKMVLNTDLLAHTASVFETLYPFTGWLNGVAPE